MDMKHFLKAVSPYLGAISAIASIISLPLALYSTNKVLVVVVVIGWLVFTTISLLCIIIYGINKFFDTNFPDDYETKFMYVNFVSDNKVQATYETYKHIQCKRILRPTYVYPFKWSGTKPPVVTSKLQTLKSKNTSTDPSIYDSVTLEFNQPLHFNETEVIHFRAELDDADNKAQPYLSTHIKHNTRVVHFVSELRYKPIGYEEFAVIEKVRNGTNISDAWSNIASVPFKNSKYEYILINPEVGYHYRLRWTK